MKEWLKKHWKIVAAVGAGAIGLYLLWQRGQSAGGGAPAAADTGSGLPSTGPPPASSPTANAPAASYLNPGEQAAAGLAQYQAQQAAYPQPLSIQQQISNAEQQQAAFLSTNPISGAAATGTIQQRWKQVVDAGQTFWVDVSGKNRAPISEQLAELEAQVPKGEGPYYQSAGGTGIAGAFNKYILPIFKSAAQDYAASQGVPISANDQIYQQSPVTTPAPSVSPVPLGPPAPQAGPSAQQAMVASAPSHGPTTPHGIPNHAVGVH